ncbi:uncharacterized protein I303_104085 [Kwoniella dejecticola CBS 10117]|uniref:DUF7726 domain-containing protein n=1 Tax=Kwoniella dejecticola CBS 10117 TaxID=1296121 RepID=A0A1A6A8J1_9TREE|nr:uncharacterized protein I303_04103 [Kwoniella dejecticola CBS 10117]OBR86379.1 hypothetical protein I303_04103 [Kwoniella dejecticola CBS 10117]
MAGFGKTIAEMYNKHKQPEDKDISIQYKQIKDFLEKSGPTSGCTSKVFYGSYVYFEKLRIKHNKPKSNKRLEMEKKHGKKGLNIERDASRQYMNVGPGETPYIDGYGGASISRRPW